MNTQKQDIEAVNQETQWQAPKLVELGEITSSTLNNIFPGADAPSNMS
ncbi:hypothetical protein [Tolumonas lignilytica]|nr:hypothetical protein [Tolumonas lignilytica]